MYGLLAEQVAHPEDRSFVNFRLRTDARWHDGKPITPDDVIFSFNMFKQIQPDATYLLPACRQGRTDRRATKSPSLSTARATVNCRASSAQLMVLPKHWWEGTDPQGRKRDISATTLEMPLGSGPYRIKEFVAGRSLSWSA